MKVLLTQDVENLGESGEIVTVKDGYGRNFLIPRKYARLATDSTVRAWQEERRQSARKHAKKKEEAEILAREIGSIEVVIQAKVGEEDRIFGSVTPQNVVNALAAHGIQLDRRQITIEDDIRLLGVYSASVKVHSEVTGTVKIRVVPEEAPEEA